MTHGKSLGIRLIFSVLLVAIGLCSFAAAAMQELWVARPFNARQERFEREGVVVSATVVDKGWTYTRYGTPIPLLRFEPALFPEDKPVEFRVAQKFYDQTAVGDRLQLARLKGEYVIYGARFSYTTPNWAFVSFGSVLVVTGVAFGFRVMRAASKIEN